MRNLRTLGFVVFVILAAVSAPLSAAPGTLSACQAQAPELAWLSSSKTAPGGITAYATCTAYCAGSTTVTVSCGGGCSAVDINCPYTQGYVMCASGATTFCPVACCIGNCSYCEEVNGTACSPNGITRSCLGSDMVNSTCTCRIGSWVCPL